QKQLYIDYLNKFVETNINAIFFQVRPNADAFYDSPYESWSKSITGTAGQDPGYDVLKFIIDEAHARNIEFHAWINPYRIAMRASKDSVFPALDPKIDASLIKDYDRIRIYNPALPEVQERIVNIVKDILDKYDVDGIHMDDYFYPDPGYYSNLNDTAEYRIYGSEYATIDSFRFANVDKVIKRIHETIKNIKPGVIFSISPTSSISYNNSLYANIVKWYENQWLDVLIPQVYSATGSITSTSSFNRLVNDWNQYYKTKVALMIGHYLSRVGDGTSSQFTSAKEIVDQFAIVRRQSGTKGSILFSAKCFFDNNGHGNLGVIDVLKTDVFQNPAVRPFIGRKTETDPTPPINVVLNGTTLTWNVSPDLTSVVYLIPENETKAQIATITASNTYHISVKGKYFVTAVNKDNVESEISDEVAYN
ncbi:MAG: family 10 glycosylhydrolase, partial [Prevotellaceae bacterium]|nr:family 10 glycosylhydrolase [Prevotellaceae bacterium]